MSSVAFISGIITTYAGETPNRVISLENPDGSNAGIFKVEIYEGNEGLFPHPSSSKLLHDGWVNQADPTTLEASKQYAINWITEDGGGIWEEENGNGNGNGGIENGGRAKILNVAGYWTLGVAQGTLFMLVPMVMVGLSVGFMQRVIKLGAKVGGE